MSNQEIIVTDDQKEQIGTVIAYENARITSAVQADGAADTLALVAGIRRGLEKARTDITKPLNAQLKATNAVHKELLAPVETVEKQIKARISEWHTAEERRVRAENAEKLRVVREDEARAEDEAREAAENIEAATGVRVEPVVAPTPQPEFVAPASSMSTGNVGKAVVRKV